MLRNDTDHEDRNSRQTEGGVRRRDVMKAAGGAILADASLTTAGATDDCTYEETTFAVETAYANCQSIPVCVGDVDPECPVTAELDVSGKDCSETTIAHTFSAIGRYTFELSGCCTPQTLRFTDGQETLTSVDIPFTNCGNADLEVSNVQFCCGTVNFDLSGVQCDLTATLTLTHDDCREQLTTTVSDDGPVKFDWSGCFTPQSVTLERENGETVAELSPTNSLSCTCGVDAQATCSIDVTELPGKDETKPFGCQGVSFDVTTTAVSDGQPACVRIANLSNEVLQIDVEGDGTTTYAFTDCGTRRPGELCATAAGADEPAAIEGLTITVCTADIGGCVSGTATDVGDQEAEWQTDAVATSCPDVGGDTGDDDDENDTGNEKDEGKDDDHGGDG